MPAPVLKLLSAALAESDADLLGRFAATRDEAAFAELVRRHGPAVYRVSRRLSGPSTADDAFQATFLVLACRAKAVRKAASVGSWLIGVAGRVARQMRRQDLRRTAGMSRSVDIADHRPAHAGRSPDLAAVLDDELSRLPASLRDPLTLCLIDGRTQEQAAAALGGSVRTVRRRLDRAKAVLRARLERRGVVPAVAAGLVAGAGGPLAAVPHDLARRAVAGVSDFLTGGGVLTPAAVAAKGVVGGMVKLKVSAAMAAAAAVLVGLGVGFARDGPKPSAPPPDQAQHPQPPAEADPMRAKVVPAALALLLPTAPANAQTPEMIEKVERQLTLKRLEGVWVPDLLVTPQGAEAYPLGGRSLAFLDGNQFIRIEGRRRVAGGTFKVEDGFLRLSVEDRTPWDLEAPGVREKVQYAFQVEGDLLTLCYTVGDKGKAGDLSPGEGRQVVVYKRQKADGPAGTLPPADPNRIPPVKPTAAAPLVPPDPLAAAHRTANFVVRAPTAELAARAGEAAERHRKRLAREWLGKELPAWEVPLRVTVRVTAGGPGGATTFTFGTKDGKPAVTSAEMDLHGPARGILDSQLPHEVMHTVLAAHFGRPVPRWADEGIAVTAESEAEQNSHDAKCREYLNAGRGFRLATLFRLAEYPRDMHVLYVQGYSAVRYLIDRGGPDGRAKLLRFVKEGMSEPDPRGHGTAASWDKAAKEVYGFASVDELEARWIESLQHPLPERPLPQPTPVDPDRIPPVNRPGRP